MQHRMIAFVALVALLSAAETSARKWTDKSGKFTVEAEFVSLADGVVSLRRSDGNVIPVPLDKLCDADQEEARKLTPAAPAAEAAPADRKNLLAVIASGAGVTEDDALKDAFRDAVRQVVGAVVDADTIIKNDEVIEDKVLTYSNGFVKHWEKLSQKKQGGLVRVKIQADVERRSVVARLKEFNVTVRSLDGKSLFSEVVTQLEADKNAGAMVLKAFEGYPASVIKAEVREKPSVGNRNETEVTLNYPLTISVDLEKYDLFQTRLVETLEKLATRKGEGSGVAETPRDPPDFDSPRELGKSVYGGMLVLPRNPAMDGYPTLGWWDTDKADFNREMAIIVNTGRNKLHNATRWQWFYVPRPSRSLRAGATAKVEFMDDSDKPIAQQTVPLVWSTMEDECPDPGLAVFDLMQYTQGRFCKTGERERELIKANPKREAYNRDPEDAMVIVSPYMLERGHAYTYFDKYATLWTIPMSMKLALEELKNLQDLRSTVTASAPPKRR